MKMKKLISLGAVVCALCCLFTVSAFAADFEKDNLVQVSVEDIEGYVVDAPEFSSVDAYVFSYLDLGKKSDAFTIGNMTAKSTFQTNTYMTPSGKIRLVLQSFSTVSRDINIALYRLAGAKDIKVQEIMVDVLLSSLVSETGKSVTFSNLSSEYTYYILITNASTKTSGRITGTVTKG